MARVDGTAAGDALAARGDAAATQSGGSSYKDRRSAATDAVGGPTLWDNSVAAYFNVSGFDYGPSDPRFSKPNAIAAQALFENIIGWTPKSRLALQKKLEKAGYLKSYNPGQADDATLKAVGDVLRDSARQSMQDDREISWTGYLDQMIRDREALEASGEELGSGAAGGARERVASTDTSVREFNEGQARRLYREFMGRDPSDAEAKKMLAKLNGLAHESPTVSTTTPVGDVDTSTVTSGGIDPEATAQEAVREMDGYAEYQAAATYFPLMERLLGARASGGGLITGV